MKRIIAILLVLLSAFLLASGQTYTLEECLERALIHSRELEQAELSVDMADIAYDQALLGVLPELSIRSLHTVSGWECYRSTTATASAVLFAGGGRFQVLKKSRITKETGRQEMELVRRKLFMNTASLYLNILQDKELMSMCESRLSLLEAQMELVRRKVELKAAVRSDISMVQADITSAKVDLLDAEGNFNADRISLCELLEIDDWQSFDVEKPDSVSYLPLMVSVEMLPQMKLANLQSDLAESDVSIAKAALWPKVVISAEIQKQSFLGLTVDIPVMSLFTNVKNVRQQRLSHCIARSKADETRLSIGKELKQAYDGLENAYEKYLLLMSEQKRYEEVLSDVSRKYELGAATYFDCQTAMSGMFQARSRLLQSKYEYLLKLKLLEILF